MFVQKKIGDQKKLDNWFVQGDGRKGCRSLFFYGLSTNKIKKINQKEYAEISKGKNNGVTVRGDAVFFGPPKDQFDREDCEAFFALLNFNDQKKLLIKLIYYNPLWTLYALQRIKFNLEIDTKNIKIMDWVTILFIEIFWFLRKSGILNKEKKLFKFDGVILDNRKRLVLG